MVPCHPGLASMWFLLGLGAGLAAEAGQPCWRGAAGSGEVSTGVAVIADPAQERVLWTSSEVLPGAGWDIGQQAVSGGIGNPVVGSGAVCLGYYLPNGEATARGADSKDPGRGGGFLDADALRRRWCILADDVVLCLDAQTGETRWKAVHPLKGVNFNHRNNAGLKTGPHGSPCIAAGKVFCIGSAGLLHAHQLSDGRHLWSAPLAIHAGIAARAKAAVTAREIADYGEVLCSAHVVWAGDVVACPSGAAKGYAGAFQGVQGFALADGKELWRVPWSLGLSNAVLRWELDGQARFVVAGGSGAAGINPATGAVLWNAAGANSEGTAAVSGSYLVCTGGEGKGGVSGWRITPTSATRLWQLPEDHRCARFVSPLIHGGHAYASITADGGGKYNQHLIRIELETGAISSHLRVAGGDYNSLIGGDGLICAGEGDGGLMFLATSDAGMRPTGTLKLPVHAFKNGRTRTSYAWCTTSAYADGRVYVRLWDRMACYDLRAGSR